ncbi:hypothetical protein JHU04_000248 [Brenneria sp. 4F2]|nr:hypothetical protein [Brenneria bubanii]
MGNIPQTIFLMTIEYLWAVILYAGVFATLPIYFYRLDRRAMTLADKIMYAFTSKPPSITKSIIE